MRLEKYLANCGIATGKVIKKIVLMGEISVNGVIETNYGRHIEPNIDIVLYKNKILKKKTLKYYLLNKPSGYLSVVTNPVNAKPVVMELFSKDLDINGFSPIGRLDKDTEGVLIITNDGDLNYLLTYPDKEIDKEYYMILDKDISCDDIEKLENGVIFDNYLSKPAKVKMLSPREIHLTISEGKYHQVKKMLKAVGNKVLYLKRVRMGKLTLGNLEVGKYKEIKITDII